MDDGRTACPAPAPATRSARSSVPLDCRFPRGRCWRACRPRP